MYIIVLNDLVLSERQHSAVELFPFRLSYALLSDLSEANDWF